MIGLWIYFIKAERISGLIDYGEWEDLQDFGLCNFMELASVELKTLYGKIRSSFFGHDVFEMSSRKYNKILAPLERFGLEI